MAGGVRGQLWCRSRLSGVPDCRVRLNDYFCRERVLAYSMHPCVRVKPFETDRVLEFVPPDGGFALFEYTLNGQPTPALPFHCQPRFMPGKYEFDLFTRKCYKSFTR